MKKKILEIIIKDGWEDYSTKFGYDEHLYGKKNKLLLYNTRADIVTYYFDYKKMDVTIPEKYRK